MVVACISGCCGVLHSVTSRCSGASPVYILQRTVGCSQDFAECYGVLQGVCQGVARCDRELSSVADCYVRIDIIASCSCVLPRLATGALQSAASVVGTASRCCSLPQLTDCDSGVTVRLWYDAAARNRQLCRPAPWGK